jgi:hypothetical protein
VIEQHTSGEEVVGLKCEIQATRLSFSKCTVGGGACNLIEGMYKGQGKVDLRWGAQLSSMCGGRRFGQKLNTTPPGLGFSQCTEWWGPTGGGCDLD